MPITNIQPSDNILVNKTFTLTGTNTTVGSGSDGLIMPYKVGLKYTSTFSDGMIHYYIKEKDRPTNSEVTAIFTQDNAQTVKGNETYTGYSHGTLNKGNKYTEMVTGEFPANINDQTITFNLILQFPDNNENQDSEKGATINGKVVVNYEIPKPTTFAADSWNTIAAVVQNEQSDAYAVGSEKKVEIGGTSYTVRIANNTTPSECKQENFSETACGFVIEFVDIVEKRVMNPAGTYNGESYTFGYNGGSWPNSKLRAYANGDFFNNLPEDLKQLIIDTIVVTGYGYDDDENFTSVDKIYLLSPHEVYSNRISYDTAYYQTRQLDYYKSKGVTTSSYSEAIKKSLGSTSGSYWWLRTPLSNDDSYVFSVNGSGKWYDATSISEIGFSPAFRIG